jgi:hypothetical protein
MEGNYLLMRAQHISTRPTGLAVAYPLKTLLILHLKHPILNQFPLKTLSTADLGNEVIEGEA